MSILLAPTSMRSTRAVRKARWGAPGNSDQLLPITAARATSRRCGAGSGDRIEKLLVQSAGDEVLDLPCRDAQSGGAVGLIFGDQRAGDIVALAHTVLDRMGRRRRVAIGVEQQPSEQARLAGAVAGASLSGVARELRLNRVPHRLIDDRRVFAPQGARRPSGSRKGSNPARKLTLVVVGAVTP